jgi:hypothetical protein
MTLEFRVLILALTVVQYLAVLRTSRSVNNHASVRFGSRIQSWSTDNTASAIFPEKNIDSDKHLRRDDKGDRHLEDGAVLLKSLHLFGKAKFSRDENDHVHLLLGRHTGLYVQKPLQFVKDGTTLETSSTVTFHANNSFPTITQAPSDACSAVFDTANQCVMSFYSTSSCLDCITKSYQHLNASLPFKNTTCSMMQNTFCSDIVRCGCGKCQNELEKAFDTCFVEYDCESIDCAKSTNVSDELAILETLPYWSTCQDAFLTAQACARTRLSCAYCIDDAQDAIFKDDGEATCEEFSLGMCSAIAKDCDCGFCSEYLEDVSNTSILKYYA